MKCFGIAVTAALCVTLFSAPTAAQVLTKAERARALKLTSELEAWLDQSCQPVVDQIPAILNDFHTFQAARSTIANGYQAEIQATQTELARPFQQIEAESEAFRCRALDAEILLGEDVVDEIRDPALDDLNVFGIPMEGLALTASSIEKVEEITPELNQHRLQYDALVVEHRERAKRMATRFNDNLISGFRFLDQTVAGIQAQKDALVALFSDQSGPFAHCLGYSGSTKDEVGKFVGVPALVTPISKVLGLNVQAPEPVENIGERLVQLGVLDPPPEPKIEIKRNGEEYLELFAELLEARNEGDSAIVLPP